MAKESLPPAAPSDQTIRKHCGAKVWERGRALAKARNLKGLTRAGNELFARCAGSYGEPYQLHARLENGAISQSSCSCPFEGAGWCKHLVALLLRYGQSPADFRETVSVSAMVSALSRDELNVFVENLMRREPQLLAGLTQIYNARKSSDNAGGAASLRSNLRVALSGRGADEGRVALELAVNDATQCETKRDWARAGEIWRVLLEELVGAVPHFENADEDEPEEDEWGNYYEIEIDVGQGWAETAVAGLDRILETETLAPALREEILRTLWQCWRASYESEYFALPAEAFDRVLAEAAPALWSEVEAFLLEQLKYARPRHAALYGEIGDMWGNVDLSSYFDGEREQIVDCLSRGLTARGEDERALEILRQHGSYRQRLTLLMQARDWAAVETLALQNESSSHSSLLAVADDLEGAAQPEAAARLARRARAIARPHELAPVLEWLARFYVRRAHEAQAQECAAALFVLRPDAASLEGWKSAVALGDDWDDWNNRYPRLEKSPDMTTPLRVRLAILDGRAARALELFRLLSDREKAGVSADLARLCEAELPAKASELYRQLGEAAIASRSIDNPRAVYKRAAAYWKSARDIHKKQGAMDDWLAYIGAQREEHKRLRALLDELKQAGL